MGTSSFNYADMLAHLRGERAEAVTKLEAITAHIRALDNAITGLSALVGGGAVSAPEVRPDQTSRRSLWEEARDVLEPQEAGMPLSDIVSTLKARGVPLDSATPKNVVHSAMSRHPETFVRLKRGVWALASKHPDLKADGMSNARTDEDDDEDLLS